MSLEEGCPTCFFDNCACAGAHDLPQSVNLLPHLQTVLHLNRLIKWKVGFFSSLEGLLNQIGLLASALNVLAETVQVYVICMLMQTMFTGDEQAEDRGVNAGDLPDSFAPPQEEVSCGCCLV